MSDKLDLIDDYQTTIALLSDPTAWRVRCVDEVVIDAATSCLRKRSLQSAPLRGVLGLDADSSETALVTLPLATQRRGPLLDFDVSGPCGPAWLMPRTEIARRQARYLTQLAAELGTTVSDEVELVLTAITGFAENRWFVDPPFSLYDYLADGLDAPPPAEQLSTWVSIGNECRDILRPYLDAFQGYSAPESPALVVPSLVISGSIDSTGHATGALVAYRSVVRRIDALARGCRSRAATWLEVLADYGNHFDLMVALEVPLDEPFTVHMTERRSMSLSSLRNNGSQELVVNDARTNHVTFRVEDPNVRIASFRATSPDRTRDARFAVTSRKDSQTRAFYAYDDDRDFRIVLAFRLALLRRLQLVPYLVGAVLWTVSTGLLLAGVRDVGTVTSVASPAVLAASLLLVREPSTLGSRLRLVSTSQLVIGLVALLAVVASVAIRT